MIKYMIENDALYRYTPIDSIIMKRELVITKDEFLMCYMKWLGSENNIKERNNGNSKK